MTTSEDDMAPSTANAAGEPKRRWRCTLLFNNNESDDDDTNTTSIDTDAVQHQVDLCRHLEPELYLQYKQGLVGEPTTTTRPPRNTNNSNYPASTNYMFPSRFQGISSKARLVTEIKLAAISCGYSLTVADKNRGSGGSTRDVTVRFNCSRGQAYRNTKGKKRRAAAAAEEIPTATATANNERKRKEYQTTTTKSLNKAETCPFAFGVFLQKDSAKHYPGRWFLSTVPSAKAFNHNLHEHHCKQDPASLQSGQGERFLVPSMKQQAGLPASPDDDDSNSMVCRDTPDDNDNDNGLLLVVDNDGMLSPVQEANSALASDSQQHQQETRVDGSACTLRLHAELTAITTAIVGLSEENPAGGQALLCKLRKYHLEMVESAKSRRSLRDSARKSADSR